MFIHLILSYLNKHIAVSFITNTCDTLVIKINFLKKCFLFFISIVFQVKQFQLFLNYERKYVQSFRISMTVFVDSKEVALHFPRLVLSQNNNLQIQTNLTASNQAISTMASPSIDCPFSPTALPDGAGAGACAPRSPSSVRLWRHHNGTRMRQQHQARRRLVMAAARRRYKGTARREAALAELVERKIAEATEACEERGKEDEWCRVAWDEVEEVSQARADLRRRIAEAPGDPLEHFCAHNPTADDCTVVYE